MTLDHVTFAMTAQKNALEDVSLSIGSGRAEVAFVGPSGKSTLATGRPLFSIRKEAELISMSAA